MRRQRARAPAATGAGGRSRRAARLAAAARLTQPPRLAARRCASPTRAGSAAERAVGMRGGSTATTPGARSRSSAWSRRMKLLQRRAGAAGRRSGRSGAALVEQLRRARRGRVRVPRPMAALLNRLIASGAAYQASSRHRRPRWRLFTLPLYTRAPDHRRTTATPRRCSRPSSSSRSSLRLGIGEAFVRFWFDDDDPERRRRVSRRDDRHACSSRRRGALVGARLRRAAVRAAARHARRDAHGLRHPRPLGVHEPRDRLRAAARRGAPAHVLRSRRSATSLLTVALTVTLVVVLDEGARGYVLGNYAASTVVLARAVVDRCADRVRLSARPRARWAPLLRFGGADGPRRRGGLRAQRRRPRLPAARRGARPRRASTRWRSSSRRS